MSNNSIYRVQSIERAFEILETVAQYEDGVKVSDLTVQLDLKLPTVHRIVSFLEHLGYLEQDPETKKYYLGLKVLELQGFLINRFRVVDNALPELKKIAYDLGETVHMGILSDGDVVYIESLQGANTMISKANIGKRASIHSTALGKALVAWMPWEDVQQILREKGMQKETPNTIDNEEDFKNELAWVREHGYAIDRNERSLISQCVAVPIWNYRKEVEAAVSVSFASQKLGKIEQKQVANYLLHLSEVVSRKIGYRAAT